MATRNTSNPGTSDLVAGGPSESSRMAGAFKPTDSFFIDSINEKSGTRHHAAPNRALFEPEPVLEFAPLTGFDEQQQQINFLHTLHSNKQQNYTNKIKNWKSESNLAALDTQPHEEEAYDDYENYDYYLNGVNSELANGEEDEDEEAEEDDEDEDEVNNEPLQFSDHPGLYDTYENDESLNTDELNESRYLSENKRRLLLTNYDIYKLTKKNYKLTYDNNSQQQQPSQYGNQNANKSLNHNQVSYTSSNNNNNYSNRINPNSDSLTSSALMQQSSNLDGSNYMEDEEEDDEEEDDDVDDEEDYVS